MSAQGGAKRKRILSYSETQPHRGAEIVGRKFGLGHQQRVERWKTGSHDGIVSEELLVAEKKRKKNKKRNDRKKKRKKEKQDKEMYEEIRKLKREMEEKLDKEMYEEIRRLKGL